MQENVNKITMIKERIIELIEYKGLPKENFYKKIGITSANFRGASKKRPLNSNAIENILTALPDVNPEWLLTGKGSMLRTKGEERQVDQSLQQENTHLKEMVAQLKDKVELQKDFISMLKDKLDQIEHTDKAKKAS